MSRANARGALTLDREPLSELRASCRYLQDEDELRLFFSAFHMLPTMPHTVIVDDFSEFFPSARCAPTLPYVQAVLHRSNSLHTSKRIGPTSRLSPAIAIGALRQVPRRPPNPRDFHGKNPGPLVQRH